MDTGMRESRLWACWRMKKWLSLQSQMIHDSWQGRAGVQPFASPLKAHGVPGSGSHSLFNRSFLCFYFARKHISVFLLCKKKIFLALAQNFIHIIELALVVRTEDRTQLLLSNVHESYCVWEMCARVWNWVLSICEYILWFTYWFKCGNAFDCVLSNLWLYSMISK